MGQDLISFILVGPTKLNANKHKAAVKRINDCLKDPDFYGDDSISPDCSHNDFVEIFNSKYHGGAVELVNDFVAVWENGARDTNDRLVDSSDDHSKKIVVAGDSSYGDEPDGFGYQAIKWAVMFDIHSLFQID